MGDGRIFAVDCAFSYMGSEKQLRTLSTTIGKTNNFFEVLTK